MTPRQPFVGLALCAVVGIAVADRLADAAPLLWPYAAGSAGVAFALTAWLRHQEQTGARRKENRGFPASRAALWFAAALFFFFWSSFRLAENPARRIAAQIPGNGCVVRATGVVDEEPAGKSRFRLRLETIALDGGEERPAPGRVLVQWPGEPPAYGDRVKFTGSASNLTASRNPGEFDNPTVRKRQGIYSEIRVRYPRDAHIAGHGHGFPPFALAFRLRHWMERTMALDLDDSPQLVALIQSMVLGSRGDSLAEMQTLFQYTGTLHLFAVSGMNIAMLAAMAAWLLQALGVRRRGMALLILPLLWGYCFATGLSASSLRATVMATVAFAGIAMDRPALPWNTLGVAAVIILLWEPNQLFTPGFALSFLLVVVLMGTARPVQAWLSRFGQPDPFLPRPLWTRSAAARSWAVKQAAGDVSASVTAWVGSMPLMIFYFHLWSPSTVPANLLAVLLAWAILVLGLGSVLAGTCCQWLAITFNNANWLFAKLLLAAMSFLAALPGSHRFVATPSFHRAAACEVEVLDLAGGGAIHLRTRSGGGWLGGRERRDWLIDCGSAAAFSRTVAPYLHSRGVNRLDGLILTHGDSKHLGGAQALLAEMAPAEVFESPLRDRSATRRDLQAALAARGSGSAIVWRGDQITLAPGVTLRVLFPPEGLHARAADDKALVLRLDFEGTEKTTRILFTSDSGFLTESWLLEHAPAGELQSDILVKGMHPSDLSGTPEFLKAVNPGLVVTSGADFPPAERVTETWAAAVAARGISLLRQDQSGAVHLALDARGNWSAEPYKGGPAFRSSAR